MGMHMHNWFIKDDEWFIRVSALIGVWQTRRMLPEVQVQLVSFMNTFNSRWVLTALEGIQDIAALPITEGMDLWDQDRL